MPAPRRLAYGDRVTRTSKRQQRSAAEWSQLIRRWEASGLSADRFAQDRGFSASSLYAWRKRLRTEERRAGRGDPAPEPGFVPLVVEDAEPGGSTRWQLETASGLAITMSGPDAVRGLEIALQMLDDEGPA